MSLIRKPSELEVKQSLSALIYGQPGLGKSTIACSAPNAVLCDFDGGVSRINGAHQVPTVQVHSWEEFLQALEEIKASTEFSTIVIDTVGKMLAYMEDYIKRTDPRKKKADGSLSLQGFGVRKQMFINFIKDCSVMGKHVIFVAHEIEQKRGDETIIRPEVGGSSSNDLIKELDLVGYMEMYGNKRTISFTPCEKYYAKNTCNMAGVVEVPALIDDSGNIIAPNNFMCNVINAFHARLANNIKATAEFENLVTEIKSTCASIESADDANKFVEWVKSLNHVYNSKAVALAELQKRASAVGLTYDKINKQYA